MTLKCVLMVCAFPPPVGGSAKVSEQVSEDLKNSGVRIRKLSVSVSTMMHAPGLSLATARYHFSRIARNLRVALQLLLSSKNGTSVYMVPSAGLGLYYSFVHFLIVRFFYRAVVIQHHSYYGGKRRFILGVIARLSGRNTIHSFSSHGMAQLFRHFYGPVQTHVATNARFIEANSGWGHDQAGIPVLGHLSNLCKEKGFHLVVDLFESLVADGFRTTLKIAGPVLEQQVQLRLDHLMARYPEDVIYLGPLYGVAKTDFYRSIDLFIFPSQFSQEAHPLVIYEAQAAGVPVLATDRGGIAELLGGDLGDALPETSFVADASERIKNMSFDRSSTYARRQAVLDHFIAETQESNRQYTALYLKLRGIHESRV